MDSSVSRDDAQERDRKWGCKAWIDLNDAIIGGPTLHYQVLRKIARLQHAMRRYDSPEIPNIIYLYPGTHTVYPDDPKECPYPVKCIIMKIRYPLPDIIDGDVIPIETDSPDKVVRRVQLVAESMVSPPTIRWIRLLHRTRIFLRMQGRKWFSF